ELPWTEKYKPQKISDLIENITAIRILRNWLENWPGSASRQGRALLVHGPAGAGKTVAVYVIASELGFEVTEINASDKRSKKMILELLKTATTSGSLFSKRGRIILVDELEGLSGREDRGAAKALVKIIQGTRVPVILVVNDIEIQKIRPLKKFCRLVEFQPLTEKGLIKQLRKICAEEQIECDDEALKHITRLSRGDMRAAINDLQGIVTRGGAATNEAALRVLKWRDRALELEEPLDQIFYAKNWNNAVSTMQKTDIAPDELLRWISTNIPLIFRDTGQLSKAFHWLSRSSIFSRRIRQTQNWKLLPYTKELMCITGSIIDGEPAPRPQKYRFPEWILQMGRSKFMRQKRKEIGLVLAPHVHTSWRKAYHEYVIVLHSLLKHSITRDVVIKELELSEGIVKFILQMKST
ncbi:replication factor C large subunit, partial [bacterium]|nr:replication factor C large subunit [bacterium]